MKICFISTYFYPFEGGAERNCYFNSVELAKNNDVTIFTSNKFYGKKYKKYEIHKGVKIFRLNTWLRLKYYFVLYPSLIYRLLKEDFDIVHTHSIGFLQHDIAIFLKKLFSPKTVFVNTPHGPTLARAKTLFQKSVKKIIMFFDNFVNSKYDLVVLMSPFQKNWLRKHGLKIDASKVISAGLQDDFFKKNTSLDKKLEAILKKRLVISYIGRIHSYKGLDHALFSLKSIVGKHPNLLFVIGGKDAGYEKTLKKLVKELGLEKWVLFLGEVSENQKIQVFDTSEIFLFPSEDEAFGISMIEAMARGNAVVSTKTEGGRFLIEDSKNGFLIDYGDVDSLSKKLKVLIENVKLRNNMKANNMKKAKNFKWSKLAKELEICYLNLLKKKNENFKSN